MATHSHHPIICNNADVLRRRAQREKHVRLVCTVVFWICMSSHSFHMAGADPELRSSGNIFLREDVKGRRKGSLLDVQLPNSIPLIESAPPRRSHGMPWMKPDTSVSQYAESPLQLKPSPFQALSAYGKCDR